MEFQTSRRRLLGGLGALAITSGMPLLGRAYSQPASPAPRVKSSFKLSVINDEVSQDFERSCQVISQEFGLSFIELRGMWKKNILKLDTSETAEAQRILKKYELKVHQYRQPTLQGGLPRCSCLQKICFATRSVHGRLHLRATR